MNTRGPRLSYSINQYYRLHCWEEDEIPRQKDPIEGAATSREVVKEQDCIFWSFLSTKPHCTGSRWASLSASGRWHAALMAALQVDASGIAQSFGYLRRWAWMMWKINCRKKRLTAFSRGSCKQSKLKKNHAGVGYFLPIKLAKRLYPETVHPCPRSPS